MGVFEFIVLLVLISTGGKVLSDVLSRRGRDAGPALPPEDLRRMTEMLDDLSGRVHRLEEERDFYRDLLESPRRPQQLEPPDG